MPAMSSRDGPPHLLTLAPELIYAVCESVDREEVKQLRLTCKRLADLLLGRIFESIEINIHSGHCDGISKLVELASSQHPACDAARRLSIMALAPSYNIATNRLEVPKENSAGTVALKENMDAHLFDAIRSMNQLQSVTWQPVHGDDKETQLKVMEALKALTNLSRFEIRLYHCKIPLELDAWTNLQDITLRDVTHHYRKEILESTARLVAKAPGLTTIDASTELIHRSHFTKFQSLHQLFKYYPVDRPPLRLKHLRLTNWMIRLDDITLPHLIHLTSLNLMGVMDPLKPISILHLSQEDPARVEEKRQVGSSEDEVWKAIHMSGIRLQEITAQPFNNPSPFFDYLSSYSGLKKLVVVPGQMHRQMWPLDDLGKQFFDAPLLSHAQALEHLEIWAPLEGFWCFGHHNSAIISKLTHLRVLGVCIKASKMTAHDSTLTERLSDVDLFLQTVLESMPHIECIGVTPVNTRLDRIDNPLTADPEGVLEDMITTFFREYIPPPSCHRLPAMMFGDTKVREKTKFMSSH